MKKFILSLVLATAACFAFAPASEAGGVFFHNRVVVNRVVVQRQVFVNRVFVQKQVFVPAYVPVQVQSVYVAPVAAVAVPVQPLVVVPTYVSPAVILSVGVHGCY